MIISISGKPGAGKTTVANILAQRLSWPQYYIGEIRRKLAAKRSMTIQEYNKLGETDPSTDIDVDKYQEKLGKTKDNFIIQGRTSFKFIPQSFKVYIDVDQNIAAERIWHDTKTRNEGTYKNIQKVKRAIKERTASDKKRYKKYYGVDVYDISNYDMVIDATHKSPEQIADEILKTVKIMRK